MGILSLTAIFIAPVAMRDFKRVLIDDGCLDMDMKSNICPYYVQGMSNLCLGTGSVQFLSPLGQNSVNPPQISHEGGQRLDLKIQSLSRYCPKNL